MNFQKICLSTSISLWSGFGFYRGYQSYENNKVDKLKAIGYGICAIFIYINPLALPLILEAEYKNLRSK
jgi:hypothetical protein